MKTVSVGLDPIDPKKGPREDSGDRGYFLYVFKTPRLRQDWQEQLARLFVLTNNRWRKLEAFRKKERFTLAPSDKRKELINDFKQASYEYKKLRYADPWKRDQAIEREAAWLLREKKKRAEKRAALEAEEEREKKAIEELLKPDSEKAKEAKSEEKPKARS